MNKSPRNGGFMFFSGPPVQYSFHIPPSPERRLRYPFSPACPPQAIGLLEPDWVYVDSPESVDDTVLALLLLKMTLDLDEEPDLS